MENHKTNIASGSLINLIYGFTDKNAIKTHSSIQEQNKFDFTHTECMPRSAVCSKPKTSQPAAIFDQFIIARSGTCSM